MILIIHFCIKYTLRMVNDEPKHILSVIERVQSKLFLMYLC